MAYKRKTKDEFVIQGNYGQGFEDELTEDTRREARERLKEYRENGPGAYRLITRRVRIEDRQTKDVQYKIQRKFYRNKRDIETGNPFKVYEHDYFAPMSLDEARIVLPKLAAPNNAIDCIAAIED